MQVNIEHTRPDIDGYRLGTLEEAQQLGLELQRPTKLSHAQPSARTRASPR